MHITNHSAPMRTSEKENKQHNKNEVCEEQKERFPNTEILLKHKEQVTRPELCSQPFIPSCVQNASNASQRLWRGPAGVTHRERDGDSDGGPVEVLRRYGQR